jgi:RNA polymerase sigma factor (sigma-70 family)
MQQKVIYTPSEPGPVFRKDLENRAFADWRRSTGIARVLALDLLRELLTAHASAVMFAVLRRNEPDLVTEAVDRVVENLENFREESLFSTWAHRVMLQVMYYQRRVERRRKEIPYECLKLKLEAVGENSLDATDIVLTVRKTLSSVNFFIFEKKVLEGMNVDEIAEAMKVSRWTVTRRWNKIRRMLEHVFAK